MIALMCLSALNLICTIIVLRFYYHTPTPPPACLRKLISTSQVQNNDHVKPIEHVEGRNTVDEYKAQWEKVAKLVDHVCFGIFLLIIVVMTFVVIGII